MISGAATLKIGEQFSRSTEKRIVRRFCRRHSASETRMPSLYVSEKLRGLQKFLYPAACFSLSDASVLYPLRHCSPWVRHVMLLPGSSQRLITIALTGPPVSEPLQLETVL